MTTPLISEVAEILHKTSSTIALNHLGQNLKGYQKRRTEDDGLVTETAAQILQLLKDKLLERAEQQQILVGWKKDMNHTPIHQDWQAIPVSEVHKLLGDGK